MGSVDLKQKNRYGMHRTNTGFCEVEITGIIEQCKQEELVLFFQ